MINKNKLNVPDSVMMFLTRIKGKIKRGEYNEYLNIPFASKELLCNVVETKVIDKVNKNQNPLLNERELMECVQETIETAAEIASIFIGTGVIEKTENGYDINKSTKKILKDANRF